MIYSIAQIKATLAEQHSSKTIVCTCGCFEIFHVGHLECLEKAKELGDILIVGINSDKYIEERKNRKPIFNENERCEIIASLRHVDYVFLFDDPTFDNCLTELRPNYFAKGVDRTEVLEQKTAAKLGIEIVHIGEKKRASATDLRKHFLPNKHDTTPQKNCSQPGKRKGQSLGRGFKPSPNTAHIFFENI